MTALELLGLVLAGCWIGYGILRYLLNAFSGGSGYTTRSGW